jgi:hypothetical protein
MVKRKHIPYDLVRAELERQGGKLSKTARALGCSVPTVMRARNYKDARKTKTDSPGLPGHKGRGRDLGPLHPAVLEDRTLFPTMVRDVGGERLLKSGINSAKIGGEIFKGKWKGFKVYTLTLEERATCPRSCHHWQTCYGNGSPYSRRFRHGPELEAQLVVEIDGLARKHPHGFAVRLHSLGDFFSVRYVALWLDLVMKYPALHVFGYTAHIDTKNDEIAAVIALGVKKLWERFAIRRSDGPGIERNTISIDCAGDAPADAVICPAQLQQSESCSTCGLCWSTDRRIAFVKH